MTTAPVALWPHQAIVARRLITAFPYSFFLCDEVGLGMTIETGLVLRALLLTRLAKRVLIAPPVSLARQWLNEHKTKFCLRPSPAAPRPPWRLAAPMVCCAPAKRPAAAIRTSGRNSTPAASWSASGSPNPVG